jgi:hypothetical protein
MTETGPDRAGLVISPFAASRQMARRKYSNS